MKKNDLLARCTPLAVFTAAALSPLSAAAQDASAPVIVLPSTTAAPPEVAPAIVVPEPAISEVTPALATPAPAAPAAVSAAPAAPRPSTVRNTATTVARSRVSAAAPPAAPAVTPAAAATPVSTMARDTIVSANPAPAAAQPDTVGPVTARDSSTGEMGLAALLGALGLVTVSGVAYVASRRRRRQVDPADDQAPAYGGLEYGEPSAPVTAAFAHETAMPSTAVPASFASTATPAFAQTAHVPQGAGGDGDPIALPKAMPESFEERDALLKKLVAAEPDRANPFTSTRARARRAKLIMQSLDRSFRSRKPRIDLSEYTHRWPSLRGWQPATA